MSHDDFKFEPIRGLPERLPDGEEILWQGAPGWLGLAFSVFHVRLVAVYFAAIAASRVAFAIVDGQPVATAVAYLAWPSALAFAAIAVLCLIAWGYQKTTVYTITNRRIVIRSGIAFQVTFNLPFRVISNVGLRLHRDRTGDIALTLNTADRIGYAHLWPHVRPWKLTNVQPMIRNVGAPQQVAATLADALLAQNDRSEPQNRTSRPTMHASQKPAAYASAEHALLRAG